MLTFASLLFPASATTLEGHVSQDQQSAPGQYGTIDSGAVGDLNHGLSIELEVDAVDPSAESLWRRSAPTIQKDMPDCYTHYKTAHDLIPSLQSAYRARNMKLAQSIATHASNEDMQGFRCATQPHKIPQPRNSHSGQVMAAPMAAPVVTPMPERAVQDAPGQSGYYQGYTSETNDPSKWAPPCGVPGGVQAADNPNAWRYPKCLKGGVGEQVTEEATPSYGPPQLTGHVNQGGGAKFGRIEINRRAADFTIGNDDGAGQPGNGPRYTRTFDGQSMDPIRGAPRGQIYWARFWGEIVRDMNGPGSHADGLVVRGIQDSQGRLFSCNFTVPLYATKAQAASYHYQVTCIPTQRIEPTSLR